MTNVAPPRGGPALIRDVQLALDDSKGRPVGPILRSVGATRVHSYLLVFAPGSPDARRSS
jgi:hypothetical protein